MSRVAVVTGGTRRAEIARQGFEKALANMRQLAETATEILRQRFEDGLAAMRNHGGAT